MMRQTLGFDKVGKQSITSIGSYQVNLNKKLNLNTSHEYEDRDMNISPSVSFMNS